MAKKTTLLILVLFAVTAGLLFLALKPAKDQTPAMQKSPPTSAKKIDDKSQAFTTLAINPNPATANSASPSPLTIDIATGSNKVTAVQFEISYDPKAITNVKVTPATFFTTPVVFLNQVDAAKGIIVYAIGIAPTESPVSGKGSVVTISYTPIGSLASDVTFLPHSLVTADGIDYSVLKSTSGTTITAE